MQAEIEKETFIKELVKAFPNLAEEVLDEDNLGFISLQISWFTRYTQQAINNGDVKKAEESFLFINHLYDKVSQEILNSIDLSYLNKLEFNDNETIKAVLPVKLKETIDKIKKAHNIPMDEKVAKFIEKIRRQ